MDVVIITKLTYVYTESKNDWKSFANAVTNQFIGEKIVWAVLCASVVTEIKHVHMAQWDDIENLFISDFFLNVVTNNKQIWMKMNL